MKNLKWFSIFILIFAFLTFFFYQTKKESDFQVLKIISPTQIAIDINKNKVEDDDEVIILKEIQTFSSKLTKDQVELAKKLKISQETAIGLGFLTENFAKETLEWKNVKIQNSKIIVDNKNYQQILLERGFALLKGKAPSSPFLKNIEKVKKLNLVIFNNKSHKYHKLTCKYGLIAHNSQILATSQIPQDAKPCKFCLSKQKKLSKEKEPKRIFSDSDKIPKIKCPPTVFQTQNIKIFLTDMTRTLKPSNSCNTELCKELIKQIDSAQVSIDFAIYGYSKNPSIENSLKKAQQRGVKIRFVYDSDSKKQNIYPDTLYLSKTFTSNAHDLSPRLMHNKFFIFDDKNVFTGSANMSSTDMSGFNSNAMLLINSEKVADIYRQEFEQMYNGRFHNQKVRINDKAEDNISVYFSPKDKGINSIIPIIKESHKYIYIPAFLITHKELTNSLIDASRRGVAVKIILDATNTHSGSHSKLNELRSAGIKVKTENFAGKLHSKSIIIDDKYTIIGSMNFSNSGDKFNDENLVTINNPKLTVFYKTFFQYLWNRIPDYWLSHNARAESPDSIGSCSDGIDNDFDGKIDKADESCKPDSFKKNQAKKQPIYKK